MNNFLNRLLQRPLPGEPDDAGAETRPPAGQSVGQLGGDAAPPCESGEWRVFQARMLAHQLRVVEASGLFDPAYYLRAYPDIAGADIPPLEHFFCFGFKEGRRPNAYFDPAWYLGRYPDVLAQAAQPLLHFILHGEKLGYRPCPLFDPVFYRQRYGIAETDNTLAHYLARRMHEPLSPLAEFDADFYAARNPDLANAGIDLFEHFFNQGFRECRDPSPAFDVKFYTQRYLRHAPGENPFLHYLEHRHEPGVIGRLPDNEATVPREIRRFTSAGPEFETFRKLPDAAPRRFKLLAYHLPQFHAFGENDAWWGQGFTEWTNIARGVPRFAGHYQPRIPRDLGFYTLDSAATLRRQAAMARQAGIYGFVFYYYWFNGRRLMDRPVDMFLEDASIAMPFALMWANENWTRRWDGSDDEVLISQDYRAGDDARLVAEFARHFRDPRYIRVQGRPVLMIYRPGVIPDARASIARWRALFREAHGEDPVLVNAQAFNALDPRDFGLDGAIEFPPHKLTSALPPGNAEYEYLDPDFKGRIYAYDDVTRISLAYPPPDYPLIKTAMPSWDNDARRQGNGIVVTGSTPRKYEAWLAQLGERAASHPFFGEPFVCVNAWNEWCEGAYLEPDLHFGAAYLNATARAVSGRASAAKTPRVLLVGHDAFAGGAQHLLLHIGRTWRHAFGVECEFLLLDGGSLLPEYEDVAPVHVVASDEKLPARLAALAARGFTAAVVNSAAAARAVAYCRTAGMACVLQVHELPRILRERHLAAPTCQAFAQAEKIVFAAPFVRDEMLSALYPGGVPAEVAARAVILPQGSYKDVAYRAAAGRRVRAELGLKAGECLVLGAGYADLRKGFDLFLQLWRLLRARPDGAAVTLAWVGAMDPGLQAWLGDEINLAEAQGGLRMLGFRADMDAVYSAADAFVLTSREDPYPTVVLEALSAGLQVAAFDRAGGIPGLLRDLGQGVVVPYGDTAAMADSVCAMLAAPVPQPVRMARHGDVAARFDFTAYAGKLRHLALPDIAAVSVAVPNYNYARYMADRLGSIFRQTMPVHEILVLDDCSTDDSLEVIAATAQAADRAIRFVPNDINSGSVFAQWRKAAELATGDLLWIAEADDLAEPGFLAASAALFAYEPDMVLAFTDSRTIDAGGVAQWDSYKAYYASVSAGALSQTAVFDGVAFLRDYLSVKNLILNVSAVLWRRSALLAALDACQSELGEFRMAGDWRLYLQALSRPGARVGYEAAPLNVHRRHTQSVTHVLNADVHVAEIARCHEFARQSVALPGNLCEAQSRYIDEVSAQLGASTAARKAPRRRKTRAT